eukprot:688878-Amphidinium_carterae.1
MAQRRATTKRGHLAALAAFVLSVPDCVSTRSGGGGSKGGLTVGDCKWSREARREALGLSLASLADRLMSLWRVQSAVERRAWNLPNLSLSPMLGALRHKLSPLRRVIGVNLTCCRYLGIDPITDGDLMWIAEE